MIVRAKKIAKAVLYPLRLLQSKKKMLADKRARASYYREIKRRSTMPVTDIKGLSMDIPVLVTNEIFEPNNFYGHADVLKKYAGLPDAFIIHAAIQHGIHLGNAYWPKETDNELKANLVFGDDYYDEIRKHTNRNVYKIGPPIAYADLSLSGLEYDNELKRLGKSLLVFPMHSTHHIDVKFNMRHFCEQIAELSKSFDSTRICLYWKDILNDDFKMYQEYGFECVTAGHIYDTNFLSRLKTIISLSASTVSNHFGSYVGQCLYFNKPHYLMQYDREIVTDPHGEAETVNKKYLLNEDYKKIKSVMGVMHDHVTDEQRNTLNPFFGFSEVKSRSEMKELLINLE